MPDRTRPVTADPTDEPLGVAVGEDLDLFDWLDGDPVHRVLTTASGRLIRVDALLPQANAAAVTITAGADLVRLLEHAELTGDAVTAWADGIPCTVSVVGGEWTVHPAANAYLAAVPEPSFVPDGAVTPVDRVLRWAWREIAGAAGENGELRPRLVPLSVADLADQMITRIEKAALSPEDPEHRAWQDERRGFAVHSTRSAPGLFSREPLDSVGRLSAWRAARAMAEVQTALEECTVVLAERWGTRLLVCDNRYGMPGDAASEIGAAALGNPDAHMLGDWLEVATGELAAGAGQLIVLGYRPDAPRPWRLITVQHGAVEIHDIAVTPA